MNNPLLGWAAQMIQANKDNLGNDPDTQKMINVLQSGDSKSGEALANEILQKAGVSRERGLQMALQRFRK